MKYKNKILSEMVVILLFICCVSLYSQLDNKNLIIHYDFENIEGSIVKDQSGRGNDGIITNMTNNFTIKNTPNVNGRFFGKVFSKNVPGKPGHITTPMNLFPRNRGDYSILFWVTINSQLSLTCGDIQFIGASPGSNVVNINTVEISGVKNNFFVGSSNYGLPFPLVYLDEMTTADEVEINKWYHYSLVSSLSNDKVILYINGEEVASTNGCEEYANPAICTGSLFIGRGAGGTNQNYIFAGMLDDFRLYDKALSENTIKAIMDENKISSVDGIRSKTSISTDCKKIKVWNAAGKNLKIFSIDGKLISHQSINVDECEIDFNSKGFYLLKIDNAIFKISI